CLPADQRGSELYDGVAAVVGSAVDAGLPHTWRDDAAKYPFAVGAGERLLGRLVLDQLDGPEVAVSPHVADDWQVEKLFKGGAEGVFVASHVAQQVLFFEEVEVGQGGRAGDWVPA